MKTSKIAIVETTVFAVTITGIVYSVFAESFAVGVVCMVALAANIHSLINTK